ncbi:MAG: hypothetical protein Q7J12_00170 [Syntrophales bacterium]|uniref:hypothetical protein n=1 Tax=Candidatus Wunengus sp. YC61 TaxID=3367698 RepID=UPI0027216458|nr:hypothetical protein [Syntrophales bacterium]
MKLNGACLKADKLAKKTGYKQKVYIHDTGAGKYTASLNERDPGVVFYILRPKEEGRRIDHAISYL